VCVIQVSGTLKHRESEMSVVINCFAQPWKVFSALLFTGFGVFGACFRMFLITEITNKCFVFYSISEFPTQAPICLESTIRLVFFSIPLSQKRVEICPGEGGFVHVTVFTRLFVHGDPSSAAKIIL